MPNIEKLVQQLSSPRLRQPLDLLADLCDLIHNAIADDPPVSLADGGTIRDGYHAELDQYRDISRNSRQYIAAIESRERAATGIQSLKVRFNNVFGFYIEVSKANLHLAAPNFERRQTLANAERFTTPELKELEAKVLAAEDAVLEIEESPFSPRIRALIAAQAPRIQATAGVIAEVDVCAALAAVAVDNRYARPRFSGSGEMRIQAGRHPVIRKTRRARRGPIRSKRSISGFQRLRGHHHRTQHGW